MIDCNDLGNAAEYAREKNQSVWLEIAEDGIRVMGINEMQHASCSVAWISLEHYRNGTFALLTKTIDEVSDMLASKKETC